MISSLITMYEARNRKDNAIINYKRIVEKIKEHADKGEDFCIIDKKLMSVEINNRLKADGFDVTRHYPKNTCQIFWG